MKIDFSLLKDFFTPSKFFSPSLEINLELLKVFGVIFAGIFLIGLILFFLKKFFAKNELKKEYYKKFYWAFFSFSIFLGIWSLFGYQKTPFLSSGIVLVFLVLLFFYKIFRATWSIWKVYPKEHEKKRELERKIKYLRKK